MTIVSSAGRATLRVLGTSFAAITQRSRSTVRLRLHLSHMSLHTLHLLTGQKSRSTVEDFMCYSHMDEWSTRSMPWACFHCANTRFSGQGQAATFSYTKAAGSVKVWSDTAAWILMVHFTSRQPFTQCYDHKLFVLCETIRGMHTYCMWNYHNDLSGDKLYVLCYVQKCAKSLWMSFPLKQNSRIYSVWESL